MCLDSGKLGYEMCAEIIADTVKLSKGEIGAIFYWERKNVKG